MAWTNIYDIGEVELLWEDESGNLRPLDELVEGTIDVIDGVIIATGVREQYDGGGSPNVDAVMAIVAVPVAELSQGATARVSVPSILHRVTPGSSGADITSSTGTAVSTFTLADNIALEPVIDGTDVVDVTPNSEAEIGDMPASGAVALRFRFSETLT